MDIYRVHLYVENARYWRDWFVENLYFQAISSTNNNNTHTELVKSGGVRFLISSPRTHTSPVAKFLRQHPPGVGELDFLVNNLELIWERATNSGAKILQPIQESKGMKWAKISGWGNLCHTLIEKPTKTNRDNFQNHHVWTERHTLSGSNLLPLFTAIDHAVLNVDTGDLEPALNWYETTLGFQRQQRFKIETAYSGLSSQVLVYPGGGAQLPINEPTSANSQIQEFLDFNNGAGIQHIALSTRDIFATVRHLRNQGVPLIEVPQIYYEELRQRQVAMTANQLQQLEELQILADWPKQNPKALLLQTFTRPIFEKPTLFLEIICRYEKARGFGEGNFRALFEAVEREQLKRNIGIFE
ncbi:MAG TPA: 4-hydroxyphenylpyruvate dioxygenase [Oscillatoriaceae cyanobacterium M33_DOE_052]|uniref:4-hydroxyphenylpyruvate dioxygenase n=1 Tax=Planktothricoides sp. SpSt-374 TaxID=2282167 RepID=A0A7C3ZQA2_9CYAN|nr:4-hydroxyphenylpyruvate dioxygenase [Oscillatoriaceae cyanobacterium M33_DOE_052]